MYVAFDKISITPPMAGYARKDPCLGKLDDIHAYGVLITHDNKNANLLLISVDILKLPLSIV